MTVISGLNFENCCVDFRPEEENNSIIHHFFSPPLSNGVINFLSFSFIFRGQTKIYYKNINLPKQEYSLFHYLKEDGYCSLLGSELESDWPCGRKLGLCETPAFHGKMAHAAPFSKHFNLFLLVMVYPIVCPAQIQLRSKSQNEKISLAF